MLVCPGARSFATDWSHDGRHVLLMLDGNRTRRDIWRYDVERREATPLLESPFNESGATFSPGGRWIAYVSDEDQRNQVYVRSFPDGLVRTQISSSGGSLPQWRRHAVRNREVASVHSVREQGLRMQCVCVEQVDAVRAQLFCLKMAYVRRDDACHDRSFRGILQRYRTTQLQKGVS